MRQPLPRATFSTILFIRRDRNAAECVPKRWTSARSIRRWRSKTRSWSATSFDEQLDPQPCGTLWVSLGHDYLLVAARPNSYNAGSAYRGQANLQPQRDSNPCRHLERSGRHVQQLRSNTIVPGQRPTCVQGWGLCPSKSSEWMGNWMDSGSPKSIPSYGPSFGDSAAVTLLGLRAILSIGKPSEA